MQNFIVTKNHLKLLKNLKFSWNDTEFGAPTVDPERPFGSRTVYPDMAKILGIRFIGIEEDEKKYQRLLENLEKGYGELQTCLEILCQNFSIEEGEYFAQDDIHWQKKQEE